MEKLNLKKVVVCILILVAIILLGVYLVNNVIKTEENIVQPRKQCKYSYTFNFRRSRS